MNERTLAQLFVNEFTEYSQKLKDHINEYDEILCHVFFGDYVNDDLVELLYNNKEKEKIIQLFNFFERMCTEGDLYVKQVLSTTILEYLGDEPSVLKTAYTYMGKNTRILSNNVEDFIERPR